MENVMTLKEAARLLNMRQYSLSAAIKRGAIRIEGENPNCRREKFVTLEEVRRFARNRRVRAKRQEL